MANEVFANDLEIACKAADGKSAACFPDPCFSPPSPSAGWILIPYANTAYAKDTTNASKTVFISGKPIMKKDVSYFKTSTGNEPAAGPKGQFTGVKKGKAYFTSWSMNVKVEGKNVDRHMDGMTHNHGSKSGNTSVWVYSDTGVKPPKECVKDCIDIEVACGKNVNKKVAERKCKGSTSKNKKDQEEEKSRRKKKGIIAKVKKALKKNNMDIPMGKSWKMTHCVPCSMLKPGLDPQKQIDCILKQKKKLEDALNNIDKTLMQGLTWDKVSMLAESAGYSMVELIGEKIILKRLRFWDTPSDIYNTVKGTDEISVVKKIISEGYESTVETIQSLGNLEDFADKLGQASTEDILGMAEYCEKKGKTPANKKGACLEQRKCLLEPYEKSKMPETLLSKQGCCPGQTAHHLIPNSMFQKAGMRGKKDGNIDNGCTGYNDQKAPNVCVSGYSQNLGTHNKMHVQTRNKLQKTLKDPTAKMTYDKAKTAGIKAHSKVFGDADCDKECLEKQLNNYYNKICNTKNPNLRKVDGMTGKHYEDHDDYCQ